MRSADSATNRRDTADLDTPVVGATADTITVDPYIQPSEIAAELQAAQMKLRQLGLSIEHVPGVSWWNPPATELFVITRLAEM